MCREQQMHVKQNVLLSLQNQSSNNQLNLLHLINSHQDDLSFLLRRERNANHLPDDDGGGRPSRTTMQADSNSRQVEYLDAFLYESLGKLFKRLCPISNMTHQDHHFRSTNRVDLEQVAEARLKIDKILKQSGLLNSIMFGCFAFALATQTTIKCNNWPPSRGYLLALMLADLATNLFWLRYKQTLVLSKNYKIGASSGWLVSAAWLLSSPQHVFYPSAVLVSIGLGVDLDIPIGFHLLNQTLRYGHNSYRLKRYAGYLRDQFERQARIGFNQWPSNYCYGEFRSYKAQKLLERCLLIMRMLAAKLTLITLVLHADQCRLFGQMQLEPSANCLLFGFLIEGFLTLYHYYEKYHSRYCSGANY